jgi:UrcA family protein
MYRMLSAVAAVVITALMFVPPAMAQSVTVSAAAAAPSGMYMTKAARVSLAGIDVGSAQGAAYALDRIEAASRAVCGERVGYAMNAARAKLFQDCVGYQTRETVAALNVPALTHYAAAR